MNAYTFNAEQTRDRLIAAIRAIAERQGFSKVILGISGGKDSTVAAALCARALGKENVYGVMMPDGVQADIADSRRVCEALGIQQRTVNIGGVEVARFMMLVGKGTGATNSGFDERPDWPKNLDLAQRMTDSINDLVSGAAREVKVKTGRFNQHVSTGALLIEVGNNRNTLKQALAACPVIAKALARVHAQASD